MDAIFIRVCPTTEDGLDIDFDMTDIVGELEFADDRLIVKLSVTSATEEAMERLRA